MKLLTILLIVSSCINISISKPANRKLSPKDNIATFQVNFDHYGSYNLQINDLIWLNSSKTSLRANGLDHDNYVGTLFLTNSYTSGGFDGVFGYYESVTYQYSLKEDSNTQINCSILAYKDFDLVRFIQHFPNGATNTSTPNNFDSVLSAFPSFTVNYNQVDIGYLSFGGAMCGNEGKKFGKWNASANINGGMSGGPLILFNPQGDTLIISTFKEFMATSIYHDRNVYNSINYGIMSGVDQVPVSYSAEFLAYYSPNGVNKAMAEWGSLLLKAYGKNTQLRDNDFNINHLAYWTDNGAYYYYNTEPYKTYQDTFMDIIATFSDIPFRSIQYDSWWYGALINTGQGVFRWDGNRESDRFPSSLAYVYNKTGLPVTAHNKYWDRSVQYAQRNGGQYNFIMDDRTNISLPCDDRFWDDLFQNSSTWGLRTYEQDWLDHQTLSFEPLNTNISLGKTWLKQMGDAALKHNITIQYCMSLSRHVLSSLEHQAVTQIRASTDYTFGLRNQNEQWRVGVSSIFAWSIGLAPFKDVYWTSGIQPDNPYGPNAIENYVELQSVVSILTSGPVGPGDKLGYMKKDLIMRSCNSEGLLLRPSKSATAIDQQIYATAFGAAYGPVGEVWSTYSKINQYTFGVILAVDLSNSFSVNLSYTGFDTFNTSIYWQYGYENTANSFGNQSPILLNQTCTKDEFCLFHIAPSFYLNQVFYSFIGDQSKWVPFSEHRFQDLVVDYEQNSISVTANGAINELLPFTYAVDMRFYTKECIFSSSQMKIKIVADVFTCS